MDGIPRLSGDGVAGLLFSLILSLDKRGILKRDDFTADLAEVVAMVRKTPFLSTAVADELATMHTWLAGRRRPN